LPRQKEIGDKMSGAGRLPTNGRDTHFVFDFIGCGRPVQEKTVEFT